MFNLTPLGELCLIGAIITVPELGGHSLKETLAIYTFNYWSLGKEVVKEKKGKTFINLPVIGFAKINHKRGF